MVLRMYLISSTFFGLTKFKDSKTSLFKGEREFIMTTLTKLENLLVNTQHDVDFANTEFSNTEDDIDFAETNVYVRTPSDLVGNTVRALLISMKMEDKLVIEEEMENLFDF